MIIKVMILRNLFLKEKIKKEIWNMKDSPRRTQKSMKKDMKKKGINHEKHKRHENKIERKIE